MIQTMFLCAGMGTRLRPLTEEVPKAMVPLGDRPMLRHLQDALARCGGQLHAVNTHHLPEPLREQLRQFSPNVQVFHEPELLGTAGGVRAALSAFAGAPMLVWNSDILAEPDLDTMMRGLLRYPMVLAVEPRPGGEGNLGFDEQGRIVRLRRRALGPESSGGNYMGILAMRPDCFPYLPERGCLIGDLAMRLMERPKGIAAIAQGGQWYDIGDLGAYLDANLRWLNQQRPTKLSWVHPLAEIGPDVSLRGSIVGSGAHISGTGMIERVVVWPGARCTAPLSDAIVTPRAGVVSVNPSELATRHA